MQHTDAGLNRLVLHAGFGLSKLRVIGIGAVLAVFSDRPGLLLPHVAGPIGDNPALGPEVASGRSGELIRLILGDRRAQAVLVQLARLALDCDEAAITPDADSVDANILGGRAREARLASRPIRLQVALGEVPFENIGTVQHGGAFQPLAVGWLLGNLSRGLKGLRDVALHSRSVSDPFLMRDWVHPRCLILKASSFWESHNLNRLRW